VVGDDVALFGDVAHNVGTQVDKASDEKESGLNAVFGQNLQQAKGVRIVGAVVESEREFLAPGFGADEGGAIELRTGRHGVVTRVNHRRTCSCD
jgi:hypothetical protein